MAKTRSSTKTEVRLRGQHGMKVKKSGAKTSKAERLPLSRRRKNSELPPLGTHVLFLFVGETYPQSLLTIHTAKVPDSTLRVLNSTPTGFYTIDSAVEIVEVWRQFLYTGELFCGQDDDVDDWAWLADMYILGVYLKDERFCNAIIDAMIDKQFETNEYPNTLATAVFAETSPGDKLRELLIDFHVWAGLGVIKNEDRYCDAPGFRSVVTRRANTYGSKLHDRAVDYPWAQACKYHKHTHTEQCLQAGAA